MKKFNVGLQNSILSLSLSLECEAGMKLTACEKQDVNEIVDDRRCAEGTKQSLIAQAEILTDETKLSSVMRAMAKWKNFLKKKFWNVVLISEQLRISKRAEKCEVKSELSATAQSIKSLAAFTLAEILLSLTIIGIVAAIALPSLLGNANERAWETQKKALYTRFSQALPLLPSLNGYGEYSETTSNNTTTITDTEAETFVRDGLSKVMKITNICTNENLADCGLPDKIIPMGGGTPINLSDISTKTGLNERFDIANGNESSGRNAAAFETVNGESILVYYNSLCMSDRRDFYVDANDNKTYLSRMCANFVYDLNGKKGPNTFGKDIGIISALYSVDPIVVAPNPHPSTVNTVFSGTQEEINAKCRELDSRVPDVNDAISIGANLKLIGGIANDDSYHDIYITPSTYKLIPAGGNPVNRMFLTFSSGVSKFYGDISDTYDAFCIKR